MSRRLRRGLCGDDRTPASGRFSWAGLRFGCLSGRWRAQQEILIRVADERLYQLKNAGQSPASAGAVPAETRPAPAPEKQVPHPTGPISEAPETPAATAPTLERRRWERVSLAGTRAYALIGEGVERTARVLDLGYGGVALETARPEELGESFLAVLHVPIPAARSRQLAAASI